MCPRGIGIWFNLDAGLDVGVPQVRAASVSITASGLFY